MSAFYFYKVSDGLCAGIQIDSAVSSQRSLSSWINRTQCVFNFTWFCLSWVVNPIWAVVIWRQNLSFFFHLVLSLLGSQSYLGCCYLKAEPFLFFHLVLSLLGSQSYLGCCYLKAKPFLFFYLVLSLMGSCFILDCVFSSYDKIILSMNRNIIKFTCLDFFPLQISLNVNHEKSWWKSNVCFN